MAKGFWDKYNEQQKKIMLEQEKAAKGQTFKPLKVGKPTKWDKAPAKKTPAKKK